MSRAVRQRVIAALSSVIVACLIASVAAPTASAATAWNYISLPTWLGNCPGGGSVKFLQVSVGNTWSGGDWGDDLVYARVNLYQSQAVVARGYCQAGSRWYWGPASHQMIYPTRQGQTWWTGPAGVRHN